MFGNKKSYIFRPESRPKYNRNTDYINMPKAAQIILVGLIITGFFFKKECKSAE